MQEPTIDAIWIRINLLEGEEFFTKTGKPFDYSVTGDTFCPSRTNYNITKSDFAKALNLVPLDGPGIISNLVRGSAYVWAVLHEKRVRNNSW